MILVTFAFFSALLASWVSYWSTNLFKSLSNRSSRITCLICPGLIAATTCIALGNYLSASGTEVQIPNPTGPYLIEGVILALTLLLVLITLMLAFFAGKLFNHTGKGI
jgi:hypothetical protein